MRYIHINMAKPGMQLARLILDSNNRVLLGTNTPITGEQISKIKERGFAGIYIEDELSKDIIIEEMISEELKNRAVRALRECNIDESLEVAQKIVEQILSSDTISLDLIDLRTFDDYTYRHSVNVCVLSTVIGINLGFNMSNLVKLGTAAILHDLGKLLIDPQILNKPSMLTAGEYEIIKQHPKLCYDLLQQRYCIDNIIKNGILHHHENQDGSGYPSGLEANKIPEISRIIHVADVYDALTSKRPYKKPYAVSEAIEYLMGGCDILFDRNIVEIFLRFVPVFPKGTMVEMSDNRQALIVQNTSNPLRPIIRFEDGTDVNLLEDVNYQNVTFKLCDEFETDFATHISMLPTQQIMVIDGNLEDQNKVAALLEKEYQVIKFLTGVEAIQYLRQNQAPSLIIIDIDLPDLDGIEMTRRIRMEVGEQIPIIFMTERNDKETVLRCKSVQAKDYIIKPFHPVYVLERVKVALGKRGSNH